MNLFRSYPVLVALLVVFEGGCTKAIREHRALAHAHNDAEAGNYDQAEIETRKALLASPNDPAAIRELGLICFAEGRMIQAYSALQKAAAAEPKDADLQLKFGLAALSVGKRKEARQAANQLLTSGSISEDAVLVWSESASTPAEVAQTRQLIESLAQKGPDQAAFHVGLGLVRLQQKDQSGAEAEFRRAIALDPKCGSAYYEWGGLDLLRGDRTRAATALKMAADLAPLRSTRRLRYIEFQLQANPAAAKEALAELNRKAPDYLPGLALATRLAYAEHRLDDCAALVRNILSRDPINYDGLLFSGMLKTANGDAPGAILDLQRANRVYHSPDVLFRLALAYLKRGDSANAASSLNQALLIAPKDGAAALLLADVEIGQGNVDGAIGRLKQLLQANPGADRPYLLLARAYQVKKQPAEALEVYRQAERKFPGNPQFPFLVGAVLNQQGKRMDARAEFEKSLALKPTYGPALEMLVNADLADRQIGRATARIDALVAKFPRESAPLLLRAKIDLAQHKLGLAETDLRQAIDLDPNSPTAYTVLARIYISSDKQQQAIATLTALADKTKSSTALMQLGQLQAQLGKYEAARASYERLLATDANFSPALNNLAYIEAEHLNQVDKALELAKHAAELRPDDPATADTLGWVLFRKGEYRSALPQLQAAVEGNPADAVIQYHFGLVNYMLSNEAQARQALRQAVDSVTDFPGKDEARQQLAVLAFDPATAAPAARTELEKWVRAHPDDPIARVRLVASQEKGGAGPATIAANLEAALKTNAEDTRTMLKLAQLYAGPLNNPDRARDLAKKAHELAPNDPQISATLGLVLYQTRDFAWSLTLLEEAAQENPGDADLNYDLARGYYSLGNLSSAQAALQTALGDAQAFPSRADAERLATLVDAAQNPTQVEAALPEARKILAGEPDYLPALFVAALAQEQQGDLSGATRAYREILARDSLFTPAIRGLALLEVRDPKNDADAYALATAARSAAPDDPDLAKVVGIIEYRRKNYPSAALALQQCVRQRSDDAGALFYLGMSHLELDDRASGKAELQEALALKLAGPDADQARRALADIAAAIKAESQQ